jgi:hypothetical protein
MAPPIPGKTGSERRTRRRLPNVGSTTAAPRQGAAPTTHSTVLEQPRRRARDPWGPHRAAARRCGRRANPRTWPQCASGSPGCTSGALASVHKPPAGSVVHMAEIPQARDRLAAAPALEELPALHPPLEVAPNSLMLAAVAVGLGFSHRFLVGKLRPRARSFPECGRVEKVFT